MNIGMTRNRENQKQDSLRQVFGAVETALASRHRLIFPDRNLQQYSEQERKRRTQEFVQQCDIIINRDIEDIFAARQQHSHPPIVYYLLGEMPRGAAQLAKFARYLDTNDLLLANCVGDSEIVKLFFANAPLSCLPFSVDPNEFYPLAEPERNAIRRALGFSERDFLLLYPGRTTLEKNVHTLIQLFHSVSQLVPEARLLIAGETHNVPFREMGVYLTDLYRSTRQIPARLGIPDDRVKFIDHTDVARLRELYNAADLVVNLTLHHDENFGLGQIEAMACGTPVVGACWGGLKDTIIQDVTGFQVRTVVTPVGVKLDWWDALNKIIFLARNREMLPFFQENCIAHIRRQYHPSLIAAALNETLESLHQKRRNAPEIMALTRFGGEFWMRCATEGITPDYRRGPRAYELYRELIRPYTGSPYTDVLSDTAADGTVCFILAAPIRLINPDKIFITDPIFPEIVSIPDLLGDQVRDILVAMQKNPAVGQEHFDNTESGAALNWLIETGIVLIAYTDNPMVRPDDVSSTMGTPVFQIRIIESPCDVLALHGGTAR